MSGQNVLLPNIGHRAISELNQPARNNRNFSYTFVRAARPPANHITYRARMVWRQCYDLGWSRDIFDLERKRYIVGIDAIGKIIFDRRIFRVVLLTFLMDKKTKLSVFPPYPPGTLLKRFCGLGGKKRFKKAQYRCNFV